MHLFITARAVTGHAPGIYYCSSTCCESRACVYGIVRKRDDPKDTHTGHDTFPQYEECPVCSELTPPNSLKESWRAVTYYYEIPACRLAPTAYTQHFYTPLAGACSAVIRKYHTDFDLSNKQTWDRSCVYRSRVGAKYLRLEVSEMAGCMCGEL